MNWKSALCGCTLLLANTAWADGAACNDTLSCMQSIYDQVSDWRISSYDREHSDIDETSGSDIDFTGISAVVNNILYGGDHETRFRKQFVYNQSDNFVNHFIRHLLLHTRESRKKEMDEIAALEGTDKKILTDQSELTKCDLINRLKNMADNTDVGEWHRVHQDMLNRGECVGNEDYNFGSMVNPTSYDMKQLKHAVNVFKIMFGFHRLPVSYDALDTNSSDEPTKKKAEDTITELTNKQNDPKYVEFRTAFRNYVASLSPILNYYSRLIAERTPVPNLITDANGNKIIPEQHKSAFRYWDKGLASPLEFEEYVATRRTRFPDWYSAVSTASLGAIVREAVYQLAELQTQFYLLHQTIRNMTAQISVLSMGMTAQNAGADVETAAEAIPEEFRSKEG